MKVYHIDSLRSSRPLYSHCLLLDQYFFFTISSDHSSLHHILSCKSTSINNSLLIKMSYKAQIFAVIAELNDRSGSSAIAIKKIMQERMPKDKKWLNATFLAALKSAVEKGELVKVKASYKISADKKKADKKKAAPKKAKAPAKKKPAAKKTAAKKKAAPKKKTATKKTAAKKTTAAKKKAAPKKTTKKPAAKKTAKKPAAKKAAPKKTKAKK